MLRARGCGAWWGSFRRTTTAASNNDNQSFSREQVRRVQRCYNIHCCEDDVEDLVLGSGALELYTEMSGTCRHRRLLHRASTSSCVTGGKMPRRRKINRGRYNGRCVICRFEKGIVRRCRPYKRHAMPCFQNVVQLMPPTIFNPWLSAEYARMYRHGCQATCAAGVGISISCTISPVSTWAMRSFFSSLSSDPAVM
jgi:hypothetical protein